MNKFRNNIFIWLSGADPDSLAKCDIAEQRKFIKLGISLLIPAILAWAGAYFTAPYIIGADNMGRLLISTIWSLIVLTIDTFLVSSMQRPKSWSENQRKTIAFFISAFSRVVMAIILGIVISNSLVLRVLEPEINNELTLMKIDAINKEDKRIGDTLAIVNRADSILLSSLTNDINCQERFLDLERYGIVERLPCGVTSENRGKGDVYIRHDSILKALKKDTASIRAKIKQNINTYSDRKASVIASLNLHFEEGYEVRMRAIDHLIKKDEVEGVCCQNKVD